MLSRKLVVVGLLLTASLGTALVGCGSSSNNVVAPDQQPLPTPDGLSTSFDQGVLVLHWDASASAAVVGYNVYKFTPDPASESAYLKLNASPISGATCNSDVFQAGGDFRVRSVGADGRESAFSAPIHLDPYSPADINQKHNR
jgi:hypothetical protein